MEEPSWKDLPEEYDKRLPKKGDLVWVIGNTRGRFGALARAERGDYGVVINSWTTRYGSPKLCILTEDGREVATTSTCARIWGELGDVTGGGKWSQVMLEWMDRTYVPIIVRRESGYKTPFAQSRDKSAYLVYPLNSTEKMWLNQDKVHPGDWETMVESLEACVSVRVPIWLARKAGFFGAEGGASAR